MSFEERTFYSVIVWENEDDYYSCTAQYPATLHIEMNLRKAKMYTVKLENFHVSNYCKLLTGPTSSDDQCVILGFKSGVTARKPYHCVHI